MASFGVVLRAFLNTMPITHETIVVLHLLPEAPFAALFDTKTGVKSALWFPLAETTQFSTAQHTTDCLNTAEHCHDISSLIPQAISKPPGINCASDVGQMSCKYLSWSLKLGHEPTINRIEFASAHHAVQ